MVLAEVPDVVVVATGGLPNTSFLSEGEHLVTDTWDVMSGAARPQGRVLVYDDNGAEPALDATELMASRGATLELVTPERMLAPDVGAMNSPAYLRAFAEHDVTITLARRLTGVRRADDGGLVARLSSDYTDLDVERHVDHVVVEHGTLPNDGLYFDLVVPSSNGGAVDHGSLLAVTPQPTDGSHGRFQLFRIGDAIASRNIHAAVYDALRLCSAL
jgi:hypothetical protein